MMAATAAILEGLVGPLFRWITLPIILIGALTFGKIAWDKRDARILAQGERICDLKWEREIRMQEQIAASERMRQYAAAHDKILQNERQTAEGLRHELDKIRVEFDSLKGGSGGGDGKCLSDELLDVLRNSAGGKKGSDPPK